MPTSPGKSHSPPFRVLVAEPDPATSQQCRDVLERAGYVVDSVDTGIAALIAARTQLPQLILMGSQLRDVGGSEASRWFRSTPSLQMVPIIILSGSGEGEAPQAAGSPTAYLRKPLAPATIRKAVRTALHHQTAADRCCAQHGG